MSFLGRGAAFALESSSPETISVHSTTAEPLLVDKNVLPRFLPPAELKQLEELSKRRRDWQETRSQFMVSLARDVLPHPDDECDDGDSAVDDAAAEAAAAVRGGGKAAPLPLQVPFDVGGAAAPVCAVPVPALSHEAHTHIGVTTAGPSSRSTHVKRVDGNRRKLHSRRDVVLASDAATVAASAAVGIGNKRLGQKIGVCVFFTMSC